MQVELGDAGLIVEEVGIVGLGFFAHDLYVVVSGVGEAVGFGWEEVSVDAFDDFVVHIAAAARFQILDIALGELFGIVPFEDFG